MPEADDLIEQARVRLQEASALLAVGLHDGAVGRAYYAAFTAARAMLTADGIAAKTHRGVIQQFGKAYVKSGMLEPKVGRSLAQLHAKRELADYGTGRSLSKREAELALELARELLAAAERYLRTP